MKRIYASLLLLLLTGALYAQNPHVLFEVGGGYQYSKTQNTAISGGMMQQSTNAPLLSGRIGYFAGKRHVIGLAYHWERLKTELQITQNNNAVRSDRTSEQKTIANAYGVFYRYYILPVHDRRWNVFAEFNPTYIKGKTKSSDLSAWYATGDNAHSSFSESHSSYELKALDFDMALGGSVCIVKQLSVQLSFRSLINANRTLGERGATQFQIFRNPLEHAVLSLNYTL